MSRRTTLRVNRKQLASVNDVIKLIIRLSPYKESHPREVNLYTHVYAQAIYDAITYKKLYEKHLKQYQLLRGRQEKRLKRIEQYINSNIALADKTVATLIHHVERYTDKKIIKRLRSAQRYCAISKKNYHNALDYIFDAYNPALLLIGVTPSRIINKIKRNEIIQK